ncbi:MAG: hypothetical protein ACE1ZX_03805, partial [Acidimicrobiia bacterium]
GITRHWLQLDHDGTAYRWSEQDGYQPIPVGGAIEHVFEGLAELGATREPTAPSSSPSGMPAPPRPGGW